MSLFLITVMSRLRNLRTDKETYGKEKGYGRALQAPIYLVSARGWNMSTSRMHFTVALAMMGQRLIETL